MSADRIALPARPRILVIALRRLGDVLLTTPLIRSVRRAWPDATIDALVFADTAGVLDGNPDLDGTVAMPPRPSARQSLALAARLWRSYDLVVSTQTGDRPTFFAWVAGKRRVGTGCRRAQKCRASPQRRSIGRRASGRADLAAGRCARHCARARNWFVRTRGRSKGWRPAITR